MGYDSHSRGYSGIRLDLSHGTNPDQAQALKRSIDNSQWPLNTIMVSTKHRVLFTPIPKNACTSLKRLFVRLSGHPDTDGILGQDIHSCLASQATGLVLGDYSAQEATDILADDSYYHFTVLRNPMERVVSAYVNKFIIVPPPRDMDGRPIVIAGTVDWVYAQRGEEPDYDRAISFEEFVESIVQNSDDMLDTHFKSQQSCLAGQHFDDFFVVEEIERIKPVLGSKFGQTAELEHANKRKKRRPLFQRQRWDQLLPRQLQRYRPLPSARFFITTELKQKLQYRFRTDLSLWETSRSEKSVTG
jgi:hypothetical protein